MYATDDGRVRHSLLMAKSGAGKTEFLKTMFYQQALRGGGKTMLDSKLDYRFLDDLYSISYSLYRESHFRVINIDNAAISHTYNPILRGTPLSVASRIGATMDTGTNASAAHFKVMGTNLLSALVGAVQAMGKAYNFLDLFILMTNPSAMQWLSQNCPPGEARDYYHIQLSAYRKTPTKGGELSVDLNRLLTQVGGVAGNLYQYSMGDMGKVMGSYSPQVDILDAIDQNLLLYVMIPRLEVSESAQAFARMFFSDFSSAIGTIYKRRQDQMPFIPHELDLDEFGSYAPANSAILFEVARGANIALSPAFQTKANLTQISEEFLMQVVGNVEMKYIMQLGDPETSLFAAEMLGEKRKTFASRTVASSRGTSDHHLDIDVFHGVSRSYSDSTMHRSEYDYRVRPETFIEIPPGRGILAEAGRAFYVDFPMLKPAFSVPYQKPEVTTLPREGLNLSKRFAVDPTIIQKIQEEKERSGGKSDTSDSG